MPDTVCELCGREIKEAVALTVNGGYCCEECYDKADTRVCLRCGMVMPEGYDEWVFDDSGDPICLHCHCDRIDSDYERHREALLGR